MRILFLNYEYPPLGGGGGVASKILVEELSKNNKIDVLTSSPGFSSSVKTNTNISIYRLPRLFGKSVQTSSVFSMSLYCLLACIKGRVLVSKKRYDLIHSFFALPTGLVGVLLSERFSVPHVLTLVGGDIYDPSKRLSPHKNFLTRALVRRLTYSSKLITAISTDVSGKARLYYGIPEKKIKIISLPFRPFQSNSDEKKNFGNSFALIAVGRLVKRKGLNHLLEAIGKLKDENVRLVIVGDGPERENLYKLTNKLNINEKVEFTGFVSERVKYKLLSSSDCFVLPSQHEGLGLVFLEAMYCGLPIITTNVGGQTDFLENEKTGLLVSVGSVDELAEAIKKIRDDSELRKKSSFENKKRVKKFYPQKIAEKYEAIYKEVLD